MKLVAGLGNPTSRYARTRHNLGFWVVDRLAGEADASFKRSRFEALESRITPGGVTVVLVKPQTYMNLSGEAVAPLARWYGLGPGSVLVVCDEMDLPAGRLRIRRKGSAGGHKGLQSVLERMGTQEVPRLRIGVDRPRGNAEAWVLASLDEAESIRFGAAADRAAEAVKTWVREGIEACMNRYNGTDE